MRQFTINLAALCPLSVYGPITRGRPTSPFVAIPVCPLLLKGGVIKEVSTGSKGDNWKTFTGIRMVWVLGV